MKNFSEIYDRGAVVETLIDGLSENISVFSTGLPNVWWVNQGKTLKAAKKLGILWAPLKTAAGQSIYFWDTMAELKTGDIVLNFYDKHIRCVSKVIEPFVYEKNPMPSKDWKEDGRLVKIHYVELNPPVPVSKFSQMVLKESIYHGPLNSHGGVNQGYLFKFTPGALRIIQQAQPETIWPEFARIPSESKSVTEVEEVIEGVKDIIMKNLNTILYGPPGTGKTYKVVDKALEIINETRYSGIINNPQKRDEAVLAFKELTENGRIEFCTFHQSFGYEEFVEGLRSDGNGGFEPKGGIFKRICDAAQTINKARISSYEFDENVIEFHKMSLGNSNDHDEDYIYDYCIGNNVITLGWGQDVDFSGCKTKSEITAKYRAKYPEGPPFNIDAINRFEITMKTGDLVFISQGNNYIRAIAKVTSEYYFDDKTDIQFYQFRKVQWLIKDVKIPVQQLLRDKRIHQQAIYKFEKKALNINNLQEYLSADIDRSENNNFVLIIDEINRGNISKIFGELITLIEPDKRIGGANEIIVTLPYSGEKFGVPSNLYILGTMNTADRSIALLDTALRRRFVFEELMPDLRLISDNIENVNARKLLLTINQRIEYLFDRDHVIGHAYFLKTNLNIRELKNIMKWNVIPLLQEYFYDDWEKIALVLGGTGNEGENNYFINKTRVNASQLFGKQYNLDEVTKDKYILAENPEKQALLNVYTNNAAENI